MYVQNILVSYVNLAAYLVIKLVSYLLIISSPWLADKTFAKQTTMYAATFELRPFKLCKVAMNNKS